MIVFITGNQFILRDFIGVNDCQDNWVPAKRAIKILNSNIRKYYKSKVTKKQTNREINQILQKIFIPFYLYSNKVQEDISLFMILK